MNYLSHNISVNLQHIRKAKGMSLDNVAEQTGVSKSMLAMIERDEANPSIGVIGKIISGLRIDLDDLTKKPENDAYMVDLRDLEPTKNVAGSHRVFTCFPIADNHSVEIYRIEVEPGAAYESGSHGVHTREYICGVEGRLTVGIDGHEWTLGKDQYFRFESDRPHTYFNRTKKKVVFLSFFLAY